MTTNESIATASNDLLDLTAELIAAYVANNTVPAKDLAGLVINVHAALASLGQPTAPDAVEEPVRMLTAAQIQKSITPDALISFIDGKPYKTLKRHLGKHGFTPDSYRDQYGLPSDYPMIAANPAAQRSAMAKQRGLGRLGAHAKRQASK